MTFPAPVIEQAIEPKSKADQEKLSNAIQRLVEEDPTSASTLTRKPVRPLLPVWASSTWMSSSTV